MKKVKFKCRYNRVKEMLKLSFSNKGLYYLYYYYEYIITLSQQSPRSIPTQFRRTK